MSAVPLLFLALLFVVTLMLQARTTLVASQSARLAQMLFDSERAAALLDLASRSVLAYDRTHHERDLADYRRVVTLLPQVLRSLLQTTPDRPRDRAAAERLNRALTGGLGVIAAYLRDARAHDTAAQTALVNSSRVHDLANEIVAAHAGFDSLERSQTLRSVDAIDREVSRLTAALVALCLIAIAVTVALSLQFGLRMTERITQLAENARRLARGDEAEHISGNDEIAQLDLVYREMMRRSKQEHDVVTVLQRALLPQTLPTVTGVRLDAAYLPAYRGAEIGGDWYDVFAISDRLLGISVGDVAGHGLRAATIMGQARQALRTASYIDTNPAAVLNYVNQLLCRSESGTLITAFFATLDLGDGTLRYAVAGHPPPLYVKTGAPVQSLPGKGFVLGVEPNVTYERHEGTIEIGSALVLFTDGIVEAERNYFQGVENLRAAVEAEYRNASGNIAEAILSRVLGDRRPADDVALLFLGVTALGASTVQPQRMVWNVDAAVERSARRVKRAVLWHLGEVAGDRVDLDGAELVVNELLGNVARHTPGPAQLALEWRNDAAILCVCDSGPPFEVPCGRPEPFAEDGRGLFLVGSVAQELAVERTSDGNRVSATLPLRGGISSRPAARTYEKSRRSSRR